MEKISGILPPSARLSNADLKSSGVARSGTPSFGRPTLENSTPTSRPIERASTSERAVAELRELQNIRQSQNDEARVEIVNRIANDFFGNKTPAVPASPVPMDMPELTEEDLLSLPELGAYLDVEV